MFKEVFGIDRQEFLDVMSRVAAADLCLRDMGRSLTVGRFCRRKDLMYKAGTAFVDLVDLCGDVWREKRSLFLSLNGVVAGSDVFSFEDFPEVDTDFSRDVFLSDADKFMDACEREARRIGGDKGVSYLMYGFYCLEHVKKPKERFLSWDRFATL